jgi:hypothetical protein
MKQLMWLMEVTNGNSFQFLLEKFDATFCVVESFAIIALITGFEFPKAGRPKITLLPVHVHKNF